MATKNQATHQGHCQVCGRLQMLPNGKLAKHGYTTKWGFFSGVCSGAEHLPFEQDISLIEGMIAWATKGAADEAATAAVLNAPATSPVVQMDVYVKDATHSRGTRPGYVRVTGTVVATEVPFHDGDDFYLKFSLEVTEGKRAGIYKLESDYRAKSALDVATTLNQRIAHEHTRKAAELTEYAAWQTKRIVGWVAHPEKLVPVAGRGAAPAKAKLEVGMTVRIGGVNGTDETVIAIETRVCRGCGPHLNGQYLPHAVFARANGGTWAIPVRLIRLPKTEAVTA